MSCRAIALSILLLAAAVPAAAQQRTPAAPPAPDCNVSLKGEGKWVKGDIIHPKDPSMGTPCTQTYTCTGAAHMIAVTRGTDTVALTT